MKRNILFFLIFCTQFLSAQNLKNIDQRVKELVSKMTLDEKISQLMNDAGSVPRLNIPSYNWWNEGLHGVAWISNVTVFPQAIGLAATWDAPLHFQVASAISDEARVKNRQGVLGLTYWSPNINIFRDPRWGRGQETYGEDPFLTSRMGVAFVKGFQGNDPHYLKLVSTPKHYAVHSGPEPLRHAMNVLATEQDIWDTYLPAFRACIVEGKAFSIMGAYTALNGVPDCANTFLLDDVLRKQWGFKGYVVSDCDAISDIYNGHKYVSTDAQASAKAVIAGCDLDCGRTYLALKAAVTQKLITEAQIDTSVFRLFRARYRLGMFDPVDSVPYNKIPVSVVDSRAHRDLALKAAQESIVLLKNENNTLPLKKDLKSIFVLGPNAADYQVLYGNYNGTPSKAYSVLDGIKARVSGGTTVNYKIGASLSGNSTDMNVVGKSFLTTPDLKRGLKAEFFNNKTLTGTPLVTRIDTTVNFDWGLGSPDPKIPTDGFSARWSGYFTPQATNIYTFKLTGDDGFRLYVKDSLVVDDWSDHAAETKTGTVYMTKGKKYPVRIEFYDNTQFASIKFELGTALWNAVNFGVIGSANLRTTDGKPGLSAEFFNNKDLSGTPAVTRIDNAVNFNWNTGSPDPKIQVDGFSARWSGTLKADSTNDYTISVTGDDGFRLFVNNKKVLENWTDHPPTTQNATLHLDKDSVYTIKLEYYENLQGAMVKMEWSKTVYEQSQINPLLEIAKNSDAIVFVGGISSALEGEEMTVNMEGFSGGDRISLDLPKAQDYILKELYKTGKPIVLVLMSGSALSVNWAKGNLPAIVESWYGGEEAGNAIASVLFGDYNPAGRLPVTFYKSAGDLPSFTDYAMEGRTYRYFRGEPLYPFGFGLSYTTFSYNNLSLPAETQYICTADSIPVSFSLTNSGGTNGDEVAQLYVTNLDSKISGAIKQLKGFKRVSLLAGETVQETVKLKLADLAIFDPVEHKAVVKAGRYEIQVCSSSADVRLRGIVTVKDCPLKVSETPDFPGKIFPNPAQDKLYIQFDNRLKINSLVSIFDAEGKESLTQRVKGDSKSAIVLDCSRLPNGVYFLRMNEDAKVFTRKFIIQR